MNVFSLRWPLVLLATIGLLFPMRAEQRPSQLLTTNGNPAYSALPDAPVITVRALKRLMFENPILVTPSGTREPVTFIIRRAGDTNESLMVYFALSGTAVVDSDYVRTEEWWPYNPANILTGVVQSVTFFPGERLRYVTFQIAQDEIREQSEMMRLRIVPPLEGATSYQRGGRSCATVWISNQFPCARFVYTPSGQQTCVERRRLILPRAFFTSEVCR